METLKQAIESIKGKRVLVAPLNWGLGHATRCVPIINQLLNNGKEVILAADGVAQDYLQEEFPELNCITLKGIRVSYHGGDSQEKAMMQQLPDFFAAIHQEHQEIKKLIKQEQIDTIISDNRFGLWNKKCETIYITHQLMVKMTPCTQWLTPLVWMLHRFYINKYDQCWIPDFEGNDNLAGDLTHKYPLPKRAQFIGLLSRFQSDSDKNAPSPYHTIVLISGPEPHRSILEEQAIRHYSKLETATLILRGQPHQHIPPMHIGNVTLTNHANSRKMQQLLSNTDEIVCRSGYSSLMDLYTLGKKATLIPTPGQTEQEYLANYWKNKGFRVIAQNEF